METLAALCSIESTQTHQIASFFLENGYHLPDIMSTCSVQQFQSVITFASKLLQSELDISDNYTKAAIFSKFSEEIQLKHNKEIAALEKHSILDLATKITPIVNKVSEMQGQYVSDLADAKRDFEKQIKELKKSNSILESELTSNRAEIESAFKKDAKVLSKRISELEAELQIASKSESSIRERCQQESDRLLKAIEEKNREIIQVKEEGITQREQKVLLKEQELMSKIQRSASSVLRGQDGEHFFKTLAKEKMSWELTKAPTFSCDYSATINNIPILFEIKNYTTTVKSEQVNKFLRDMKMHPEALVGVFVSLNTHIQGRNPNVPISFEWINSSQCAVYIQSCADLDIDYTFSIIEQIIKVTCIFNNIMLVQTTASQEPVFQCRIEQAKTYIERTVTRGAKLIKKILADKKQHIELIESATTHSITEMKYQNADLTTSIQILLGEYTEPIIVSDESSQYTPQINIKPTKNLQGKKSQSKKSLGSVSAAGGAVKIEVTQ